MDSSLLLAAALAIGFAIYYFVSKNQRYWNDRNVLVLPSSFPMGHLAGMGKVHFIDVLKESYDKFVGRDLFCGFYFITSARVLALDLDFVKHVLIKDFHYFADRKAYFNEVDDPLSGHLFNMRGAKWRQMRQQLTPTFTSGKMKAMFGLVTKETKTLITATAKMSASDADIDIDIKDLLMRYIADVIASCAFGLESRALEMEDSELMRAADQIFAVDTVRFLFMSTFEGLSRRLRLPLFRKAGTDYFMAVIRNAMDARTESQRAGGSVGKRNDFLNLLIELKNHGRIVDDAESEDLGKITFNELAAQAFIFMLAGFETTSTTMQFCLGELAANPDLQDKARLEAQRILDKNNGEFTYESLNELEFLSRCINESLRKWPAVGVLVRNTLKDYKCPNSHHVLEKDTQVMIPVYAIHRDPKLYPNPEQFDPDRFTPDQVKTRHPMAFIPFGEGPRNCIGMRFAQVQMKLGLASLLCNFRFSLSPRTKVPFQLQPKELFNIVDGGLWLRAEKI